MVLSFFAEEDLEDLSSGVSYRRTRTEDSSDTCIVEELVVLSREKVLISTLKQLYFFDRNNW